jgi:hypothetical protein
MTIYPQGRYKDPLEKIMSRNKTQGGYRGKKSGKHFRSRNKLLWWHIEYLGNVFFRGGRVVMTLKERSIK